MLLALCRRNSSRRWLNIALFTNPRKRPARKRTEPSQQRRAQTAAPHGRGAKTSSVALRGQARRFLGRHRQAARPSRREFALVSPPWSPEHACSMSGRLDGCDHSQGGQARSYRLRRRRRRRGTFAAPLLATCRAGMPPPARPTLPRDPPPPAPQGRYITVLRHDGHLFCLDSVCFHAGAWRHLLKRNFAGGCSWLPALRAGSSSSRAPPLLHPPSLLHATCLPPRLARPTPACRPCWPSLQAAHWRWATLRRLRQTRRRCCASSAPGTTTAWLSTRGRSGTRWGGAVRGQCGRAARESVEVALLVEHAGGMLRGAADAGAKTQLLAKCEACYCCLRPRRSSPAQGTVQGPDGKLLPGPWKSVGQRQRTHFVEQRADGIWVQVPAVAAAAAAAAAASSMLARGAAAVPLCVPPPSRARAWLTPAWLTPPLNGPTRSSTWRVSWQATNTLTSTSAGCAYRRGTCA